MPKSRNFKKKEAPSPSLSPKCLKKKMEWPWTATFWILPRGCISWENHRKTSRKTLINHWIAADAVWVSDKTTTGVLPATKLGQRHRLRQQRLELKHWQTGTAKQRDTSSIIQGNKWKPQINFSQTPHAHKCKIFKIIAALYYVFYRYLLSWVSHLTPLSPADEWGLRSIWYLHQNTDKTIINTVVARKDSKANHVGKCGKITCLSFGGTMCVPQKVHISKTNTFNQRKLMTKQT